MWDKTVILGIVRALKLGWRGMYAVDARFLTDFRWVADGAVLVGPNWTGVCEETNATSRPAVEPSPLSFSGLCNAEIEGHCSFVRSHIKTVASLWIP